MRNILKILAVLTITVFFSPVYPMEVFGMIERPPTHWLTKENLKKTNLPLHINELPITESIEYVYNNPPIPKNDQLYAPNNNLGPYLAMVSTFLEFDQAKNEKTSKIICKAICEGAPLTCTYNTFSFDKHYEVIELFPLKKPTPVFTLLKKAFRHTIYGQYNKDKVYDSRRLCIKAISQGHRERQEKHVRKYNELIAYTREKVQLKIPEDIASLIISYLSEYHISKESTAIVKQVNRSYLPEDHIVGERTRLTREVERERDWIEACRKSYIYPQSPKLKEKIYLRSSIDLQQSLDETSASFTKKIIKNIIGYAYNNLIQTGLILVSIPTLFYLLAKNSPHGFYTVV